MVSLPKPRSLKSPSWRLELCLESTSLDSEHNCPYIRDLHSYIHSPKSEVCEALQEAYLMYYIPQSRAVLSSLLLSGVDIVTIAGYIDAAEEVVMYYSKLFFDTSVFPNKLVVKSYVDTLPESTPTQKNYKSLMRAAISLGDRYIAWKMSLPIQDDLEPDEVTKALLEDSYWRSREHKPFSVDDSRAKESKSWVPQVMRTLDSMSGSRAGGELSLDTLRLKLVKADSTVTRAELAADIKG
jgi:hypothetical protein